jgi:hypothetical protein
MNGPRGENFIVMLKGTREERSQGSRAALYRVFTDEDVAS